MPSALEDKEAIRELFARYCFYTDTAQFEKFVALFVEDCDWDGGIFGRQLGRSALLESLRPGADTATKLRHFTTNSVIAIEGDEARATSYVTVLGVGGESPQIFFAGCYVDRLVRQDGLWLFRQRKIRTDLAEAELT